MRTAAHNIHLEQIGIDYVRSSSSQQGELFIHCNTVAEKTLLSAKNVDLHVNLSASRAQSENDFLPGMGYIQRASLKISEMAELNFDGHGRLSQPLYNTTISYESGVISTDIDAVQLKYLGSDQRLALGLTKLSLKVQQDTFDNTLRIMAQSDAISGNGDIQFDLSGVNFVATTVPTTCNEVLSTKALTLPQMGYVALLVLDVAEVASFRMQDGHLTRPISKLAVRFDNGIFTLNCPTLFVQRDSSKKKSLPSKHRHAHQPFELPCRATVSIGAFQLHEILGSNLPPRQVQCKSLSVALEPLKVRAGQQTQSIRGPGLGFQTMCHELKSIEGTTVIHVPRLSVTGLLQLNDMATVGNLSVGIENAKLSAEFSTSNWTGSLEKEPSAVVRLPFATIPKVSTS